LQYYDPLELAAKVRERVARKVEGVEERKYYRFRGGRWYGGIATADVVGCNLRCKFCWSWRVRDSYERVGEFYKPREVASKVASIAKSRGYGQARVSGGEPTIAMEHLLSVLEELGELAPGILFILETNGIVLGAEPAWARALADVKKVRVHVRVSLKGCTEKEFHYLTGAKPEAFRLQLQALKNLVDAGVSCHAAAMLSFSPPESRAKLEEELRKVSDELAQELEEEYVFLYPHVKELLRKHGLVPRVAYDPSSIPDELV